MNFKKEKFAENRMSKGRNLLKIEFQKDEICWKSNVKKVEFAENRMSKRRTFPKIWKRPKNPSQNEMTSSLRGLNVNKLLRIFSYRSEVHPNSRIPSSNSCLKTRNSCIATSSCFLNCVEFRILADDTSCWHLHFL